MLHLYAADRIEPLVERLAEIYTSDPADPMTPEWLAVPSAGMQRWLSLELARRVGARDARSGDGVSANIAFHFPGTLRRQVLEAGRDPDEPGPWQVERLTWTILEAADEDGGRHLPKALTEPSPGVSRYGVARRIADLFDRYQVHRPAMLRSWESGERVDGTGRALSRQFLWQPDLWNRCRTRIGETSPAERLPDLLADLRAGRLVPDLPDLPARVALFGLSSLPGGPEFLELAEAVARVRDVHFFLLEPSTRVRDRVAGAPGTPASGDRLRSEDDSATTIAHPLLRSWGRLHRESAVLLTDAHRPVETLPSPAPAGRNGPAGARSVLTELQADIRADRVPGGTFEPDPSDRSVQLHACYGPTRQVEVARDAILHLLADPELGLCEDDIAVLCPALDRFAPVVEAVFGPTADAGPASTRPDGRPPALRYRIADRSLRTTNPVIEAMVDLIALLGSRFEATSVLDFAASAPVRQRFGFTTEDLARITGWVGATNIRWGLDARHRAEFELPADVATNTWQAGIDQLLVGTVVQPDGLGLAVGDVAPFEAAGDGADLAGRLAELLGTLGDLQRRLGGRRTIDRWIDLLVRRVPDLFATAPDLQWQLEKLDGVLRTIVDRATDERGCSTTAVGFADLRRIVDTGLSSAPGRPDFFRGGVTVTSLTPLQGIPYRVVVLLGMDQSAFPPGSVDGDDLTALAPRLGDRDPRGDVRQAVLEAVLAAGERLVVIRSGHDVRTSHEIPPPVVVAELIDTLAAMVGPAHRPAFLSSPEIVHPRQTFDERYFAPGAIVEGPWSFDAGDRASALARRTRPPEDGRVFLRTPLSVPVGAEIDLATLHRFFRHPVRSFLEQRLGLRLPRVDDALSTAVPVELVRLDRTHAGRRLLEALLDGRSVEEWARVETRLGTVPPGVLAHGALASVEATAGELVATARSHGLRAGPAVPVPVDVTLADGTRLTGTVPDRLDPGTPGPCEVRFSSFKPALHVSAWLDLAALVATDPTREWRSVAVARGKYQGDPVRVAALAPAGADAGLRLGSALDALAVAVDLYRRGQTEPIPLFATFSHQVATGEGTRGNWLDFNRYSDGYDEANALVFGGYDFVELMALERAETDPDGPGGRVECFARCLWDTIDRTSTSWSPDTADADASR